MGKFIFKVGMVFKRKKPKENCINYVRIYAEEKYCREPKQFLWLDTSCDGKNWIESNGYDTYYLDLRKWLLVSET